MAATEFIQCRADPLTEQVAHDLQLWLAKPEAATLVKVIQCKAKQETAAAMNAALRGAGNAPLKMNVADEHLQAARKYLDFLEILQQIKDQTEPLTVTKWM